MQAVEEGDGLHAPEPGFRGETVILTGMTTNWVTTQYRRYHPMLRGGTVPTENIGNQGSRVGWGI